MRPGDCGRKDQILQPTRVVAQGTGLKPGHFTSRAGRSRKASGHDAVLRVLRIARNAADAVGAARPKGKIFRHPRPGKALRSREQIGPGTDSRLPDHAI